jgi:hypothetical protein
MSTRSFIGIASNDDSMSRVSGIYCHFDGYPDHHGPILKNHYTTQEKVLQLLALGSISALAPEIGEKHSFQSPKENWALAYHRDRGEEHNGCQEYASEDHTRMNCFSDLGVDYAYLFKNGKWFYAKRNSKNWEEL